MSPPDLLHLQPTRWGVRGCARDNSPRRRQPPTAPRPPTATKLQPRWRVGASALYGVIIVVARRSRLLCIWGRASSCESLAAAKSNVVGVGLRLYRLSRYDNKRIRPERIGAW